LEKFQHDSSFIKFTFFWMRLYDPWDMISLPLSLFLLFLSFPFSTCFSLFISIFSLSLSLSLSLTLSLSLFSPLSLSLSLFFLYLRHTSSLFPFPFPFLSLFSLILPFIMLDTRSDLRWRYFDNGASWTTLEWTLLRKSPFNMRVAKFSRKISMGIK